MNFTLYLSLLSFTPNALAFSPIASRATRNFSALFKATVVDFRDPTMLPETQPPSLRTFSRQVEDAIIEKFGFEEAARVIESWRLLDKDYEHREFFGGDDVDQSTSNSWQFAHSYVPGLECKPFWNIDEVSWKKKLEQSYKQIRKEFLEVTKDSEDLQGKGNNIWAGALTEEAGGYGAGWSTLVLKDRGMWDEVNCNLFPKTAKAVLGSGIPATEVFFASMKPNTDIKLHSDFTNFVLTSHLAIDIPENGNNKCRLSIGDETRQWMNGEVTLFDTSMMHDAVNESDEMRYILMFRIWHPNLSEVERNALQFIYDCLSVPDLVDDDDSVRATAQSQIETLRTFPKLRSLTTGFGGGGKKATKKKKGKRKK